MLGLLVTPAEASQLFKVPVGTLHRWAHEDRWRKYGGRRTRHWSMTEVQAGYERRRGHTIQAS